MVNVADDNIKTMGLYRNVDRVMADLQSEGFADGTPLTVDVLTQFDQYHYEGTDAVDDAIIATGADPESAILDVGSGLGGPARYIAARSGAKVTALELQADLNETARELTRRCGLDHLVEHRNGDILADAVPAGSFTGLVSMLCFLHISDKPKLFSGCASALKPGGVMFIDDFVKLAPLIETDRVSLADTIYCSYLPNRSAYRDQVEGAGFELTAVADKSPDWTGFVTARLVAFRSNRETLVNKYGLATVDSLDHFYSTVVDLFQGGRVGGLRIIARRT
jgi:cyclopropane fatty-acyl-phospholipid synthase-like methyltransferase